MIRFDRNDPFVPDFIKVTRVPVNDRPSALPETGYVNSYDFYSVYRTFPTFFLILFDYRNIDRDNLHFSTFENDCIRLCEYFLISY